MTNPPHGPADSRAGRHSLPEANETREQSFRRETRPVGDTPGRHTGNRSRSAPQRADRAAAAPAQHVNTHASPRAAAGSLSASRQQSNSQSPNGFRRDERQLRVPQRDDARLRVDDGWAVDDYHSRRLASKGDDPRCGGVHRDEGGPDELRHGGRRGYLPPGADYPPGTQRTRADRTRGAAYADTRNAVRDNLTGGYEDDYSNNELVDEPYRPSSAQRSRARRAAAEAERQQRRRFAAMASAVIAFLLVVSIGFAGYKYFTRGQFPDYTTAGTEDVLVKIQGPNVSDFAKTLVDDGVVESEGAFNKAAGNTPISAGIYKLKKHLPAAQAVAMMTRPDMANRVGRLVIPPGLQLDSKKGIDNKVTPGIFQMIADASCYDLNGKHHCVTAGQLARAASTATAEQLGIPQWAMANFKKLGADHRRIEGLIRPGAWEAVDPTLSPVGMLKYMITTSAKDFEKDGLLSASPSLGMTPYELLTSASVVEREVSQPGDYTKVARVIMNRLAKGQKLQMDSTVNYTSAVTNIDVAGEVLSKDTGWNTYVSKGMPQTPIGAVGEEALKAVLNPAPGNWLYFVTVDGKGTTLFSDSFQQHEKNRQRACQLGWLKTGC